MQDFNYNDYRLKSLGLQRLEERRMRSDLIEIFKFVNRKYDINPELFFQLDEGDRRGHDQKLFKKRFRLNVRTSQLNSTQRASMDAGVKTPQCPHLSRHYFISIL